MVSSRRSSANANVSDAARRYFQQFLGETSPWSEPQATMVRAIEAADKEEAQGIGQRAYLASRFGDSARAESVDEGSKLFPDGPTLTRSDFRTAAYVALVNVVTRELELESPAEVRSQRGLEFGSVLPGIYHDHLILAGRFSLEALQAPRLPPSFSALAELVVDRLGSLVELASQAMMGAEVDPFETMEHEDCQACGHLLQRHVGFESWDEVRAEHGRWCPKSRE